jgi:hypothetical protein
LKKNLSKPNKPIFKLLTTLENQFLAEIETAFNWFENTLQIIKPEEKPIALAHQIDTDKAFKKYAQDIMLSFNTGIYDIKSESKTLKEFFGQDNATELDSLLKRLEDSPQKMIRFNEIILVKEGDEILVKQLPFLANLKDLNWHQYDSEE